MTGSYWLRLTAWCLAAGINRDIARRMAERGEVEATLDDKGRLLIAARDAERVRLERVRALADVPKKLA